MKLHITFTVFALTLPLAVLAVPPTTKYDPGETIDPNCAPGTTNCDILFTVGDTTDDAFINNTTDNRVELGAKADGTARDAGTEFIIRDDGRIVSGVSDPLTNTHLTVNSTTQPHPAKFRTDVPAAFNVISFNVDDGANSYGTTNTLMHENRARSTEANRALSSWRSKWIDDTDATRVSQLEFRVNDYRADGTGFGPKMGIYGNHVGINTTDPEHVLHVVADRDTAHPAVFEAADNYGFAIVQKNANAGDTSRVALESFRLSDGVRDWASFGTVDGKAVLSGQGQLRGNEHLVVSNAGNIGIGAVDPTARLHIADNNAKIVFQDTDSTIDTDVHNHALQFTDQNGALTGKLGFATSNQAMYIQNGNANGTLRFSASGTGGSATVVDMLIATDGDVGIGTVGPTTKLDVDGVIRTRPRTGVTCDGSTEGGIYYDSADNHFYGCNGTTWVQLDN